MLVWSLVVLLVAGLSHWLFYRHIRLLPLGKFVAVKTFVAGGVRYTVEEVRFEDYQAAINGYFRLVPTVLAWGVVCEERYDFFDFYSVAVRFEHGSARLLRLVDRVRLILSDQPMDLDEFEQQIGAFAYQPLK